MKELSIILLNYNSSQYTINCVDRLLEQQTSIDYEFVIVDNASEDDEYNKLKNWAANKKVTFVTSKINSGFAGGNMFGVQHANGKYYLFLNNDCTIDFKCIEQLLLFVRETPDAAVATAAVVNEHGERSRAFDHFPGIRKEIFGRKFLEKSNSRKYPKRFGDQKEPFVVNAVQGSLMLFDAAKFGEVGGMDVNLFLYYEEIDICYRLKQKGYNAYVVPQASYIHYEGKSTGTGYLSKKEQRISYFYILKKNFGWFRHRFILTYSIIQYFFKMLVKPKHVQMFLLLVKGAPLGESLKHKQQLKNR